VCAGLASSARDPANLGQRIDRFGAVDVERIVIGNVAEGTPRIRAGRQPAATTVGYDEAVERAETFRWP
jgi:hypothetical protein